MIEIQQNKSFSASGRFIFMQKSIPAHLVGNLRSYSPDAVEVKIWSEDEKATNIFLSAMHAPYNLSFEGCNDRGVPIRMLGIRPTKVDNGNRIEGVVEFYTEGDFENKAKLGKQVKIHAITTPSSLINPEWHYLKGFDGLITQIETLGERTGINWTVDGSTAKLIDNYEYIDWNFSGIDVTSRIRTNSLFLTLKLNEELDIQTILQKLPSSLVDDMTLLSFIGRKRIVVTEATANIVDGQQKSFAYARYKTWGGFFSSYDNFDILRPIIRPQELRNGLFNELSITYKTTQHKDVIERAMTHLLTSYEDGYFEPHFMNAFSALECLVNSLGESLGINNFLPKSKFKNFSEKVKKLIHDEISDPNIASAMEDKIPELKSRTFIDRLLLLLEKYKVNTRLIWPPQVDEQAEFHALITRRNKIIHRGESQKGFIEYDFSRIQRLVELWILKLLNCPDEAINKYGLWRDAPINQRIY